MTEISLTINGKPVTVTKGKTVLEAARSAGIDIPTICAHEDLPHYGACRMCIVRIEGVRGLPTSCTTPAEDGMVVITEDGEIREMRGRILEMMLSGHPNACLSCAHREACEKYRPRPTKAGRVTRCTLCSNRDACELRHMTFENQSQDLNLKTLYQDHLVERDDPFMDRDFNLCILCGRCWRICEKIHGTPAISIVNRGKWAKIGTSFGRPYTESGCTFCGACVDICPTGTLTDRFARWHGEPDEEGLSACVLCSEGCSIWQKVKGGSLVANTMTSFNRDDRLCAIGRFAYSQLVNAPDRLRRPMIREEEDLIPVDWETAIEFAAKALAKYRGGGFGAVMGSSEIRETRSMYAKFTNKVMNGIIGSVPAGGGYEDIQNEQLKKELAEGNIKALLVTGDYLPAEVLDKVEFLVAFDYLPSKATEKADVVLPAAVLSEVAGTFRNNRNSIKVVTANTDPPGDARPEWEIMGDLAVAMGSEELDYNTERALTAKIERLGTPPPPPGSPRDSVKEIPVRYRGHFIADHVCALASVGLPMSPAEDDGAEGEGFQVVEKYEIVPNFHYIEIEAPQVARHAKPGQFVILMVRETSERAPFTLVDWDAEKGTISLVVEEVGRSSREVANLRKGARLAHVAGPLGLPHEIAEVGTVALGGGCYGIGGIYPIARAMKEAGNKVITVIEASSAFLLYFEDKLREVSDELIVMTKDGSRGKKGGIQEAFRELRDGGEKIGQFVAIGCTFMMRMVSEATRDMGIPIQVALNPIMVDGTGMCGACRVSVGGDTKFACVDGPMFDGHLVDWDELFSRRGAYVTQEVRALPQVNKVAEEHGHEGCGCGGGHCQGH